MLNLWQVAAEISRRLTGVFTRDAQGRRPVFGDLKKFQSDPTWRDLILFHEYFHGDSGAGLGACHQTGWTGKTKSKAVSDSMLQVREQGIAVRNRANPRTRGN
jgi:hypothetical protein